MKHFYFVCILVLTGISTVGAQNVYDFESPDQSLFLQYFGSSLEPMLTTAIANPDKSGINTSATVGRYIKAANAQTWAGGFANPAPATPIDASSGGTVCVKVWMDHAGVLALKLEGVVGGGENWITTLPYTTPNQWQELCFDLTAPSIEDSKQPAAGKVFNQIVLFFDFGTAGGSADVTYYFDDVTKPSGAAVVTTTILDFETAESTGQFSYFGSTLDGQKTEVIANPNPTGLNTSANVTKFIKPAVAETWAGAYSNPNPMTPLNLSNGGKVCIKVHMDHIGNLALKLENSENGRPNWIQSVANTKVNEWEELCFDITQPSLETPFEPAGSAIFKTVTLFFDFGVPGGANDVTSYFDDLVVKTGGAPAIRKVSFKVNMNNYSGNFDKVYISGVFNNWSGDANPLKDDDLDGIWEGDISVTNGAYEYKITLDNWTNQEQFLGTEECTKTTGDFTNRLLLVSGNTELPQLCYNSCYACGEEVKILFKLGMGNVTPNPEGVWLAGGGNFDLPGGKYKMKDPDANGIYELLVPRKRGFTSYFTFTNGPCVDYICKEILEGLPCANPSNYNDRLLSPVTEDMVFATCFGTCAVNELCSNSSSADDILQNNEIFRISSNPVLSNQVTLYFDNSSDKQITLFNNAGQQVQTFRTNSGQMFAEIDMVHYKPGMYFITVLSGGKSQTKKCIRM